MLSQFSWMEIETEADCLVMYDYYLAGYEMGYYLYEYGYESKSNRIEAIAAITTFTIQVFRVFLMGLNQSDISENNNELEVVVHTFRGRWRNLSRVLSNNCTHGNPMRVISFNDKFTEEVITCFSTYLSNITIFALDRGYKQFEISRIWANKRRMVSWL